MCIHHGRRCKKIQQSKQQTDSVLAGVCLVSVKINPQTKKLQLFAAFLNVEPANSLMLVLYFASGSHSGCMQSCSVPITYTAASIMHNLGSLLLGENHIPNFTPKFYSNRNLFNKLTTVCTRELHLVCILNDVAATVLYVLHSGSSSLHGTVVHSKVVKPFFP